VADFADFGRIILLANLVPVTLNIAFGAITGLIAGWLWYGLCTMSSITPSSRLAVA